MKNIIILYHAECPDGFGGAWAAWKKFGAKADYIGVHHENQFPAGLTGKEIYLVDIAYSEIMMQKLIDTNKRVTAIDHHVTREKAIKMTEDYRYSIDNSGSVLAWKYFHPKEPVPKMLAYIEDRDLWKFKFKDTKALGVVIDSFDYDFKAWNRLSSEFEKGKRLKEYIAQGKLIVKYEEELIERLVDENAKLINFEGYEIYAVNSPHELASDIAHALYVKRPPMAVIWVESQQGVHVSLRSDGTVDVSKIAQKFGGGGHKAAAGFSLPAINQFPWKEIK